MTRRWFKSPYPKHHAMRRYRITGYHFLFASRWEMLLSWLEAKTGRRLY